MYNKQTTRTKRKRVEWRGKVVGAFVPATPGTHPLRKEVSQGLSRMRMSRMRMRFIRSSVWLGCMCIGSGLNA